LGNSIQAKLPSALLAQAAVECRGVDAAADQKMLVLLEHEPQYLLPVRKLAGFHSSEQ
jgi:hypothetical protein